MIEPVSKQYSLHCFTLLAFIHDEWLFYYDKRYFNQQEQELTTTILNLLTWSISNILCLAITKNKRNLVKL